MNVRENVPIKDLTTMRLGGTARFVLEVEQASEVPEAYAFAREKNLPVYVLGGGANTLGRDEGYAGVIIRCRIRGVEAVEEGDSTLLTVGAGEIWDDVCALAAKRGLTGIEAMSSIPGTAGAAPVQNIGAYGQEVADVLESLRAYDTEVGEFCELTHDDLGFGYRRSILNGAAKGRYFVTELKLRLRPGQMQPPLYANLQSYLDEHDVRDYTPQAIRQAVVTIRDGKLPDPKSVASAGSFFKNIHFSDEASKAAAEAKGIPVFGAPGNYSVSSGWLIEHAGLKGQLLHGMRVCPTAALVLINESAENYRNLAAAREKIRQAVRAKFGYDLEQEPEELA